MSTIVITIERARFDMLRQLVAEAAQGSRKGWTLDRTFNGASPEARLRAGRRRAELLVQFGHEARIVEEPECEAVYVWRRA